MDQGSSLTSKGQVTIPKHIRDFLRLKPAQKIIFRKKNGMVFVQKAPTIDAVFASIKTTQSVQDFDINQAVVDYVGNEHVKKETRSR